MSKIIIIILTICIGFFSCGEKKKVTYNDNEKSKKNDEDDEEITTKSLQKQLDSIKEYLTLKELADADKQYYELLEKGSNELYQYYNNLLYRQNIDHITWILPNKGFKIIKKEFRYGYGNVLTYSKEEDKYDILFEITIVFSTNTADYRIEVYAITGVDY